MANKLNTMINKKNRLAKDVAALEEKLTEKKAALKEADRQLMEEMMAQYDLSPEDVVAMIEANQEGEGK